MTNPSSIVRSEMPPEEPTFDPRNAPGVEAVAETDQIQQDYFGVGDLTNKKFMFPDGVTFVEYGKLNEGQKALYEQRTQGDMVLERKSGNARVTVNQAKQRHELIKLSARNWNLVHRGDPITFSQPNLTRWLEIGPPEIIQDLYNAMVKINKFLREDETAADIRAEIAELQERLAEAEAREQGKDS